MIKAPALDAMQGITHAFFTRNQGVSKGIYESLNVGLGSNDERASVLQNRRIVAEHLGVSPERLATPYQIHSNKVITVDEGFWDLEDRDADAVVTNKPDIAIGVLTADCGPILFADPHNGVIGAAHAGWRGAFSGVLQNTMSAMQALGAEPSKTTAVIGPLISQRAYEVGPEFFRTFTAQDESLSRFFGPSQRDTHYMFDLPAFIKVQLQSAGVGTIADVNLCTYENEGDFFSYRRTTHRQEPDYGRQISAITLHHV